MQKNDLAKKAAASAERAAINNAKQEILFQWHRKSRPMQHKTFCHGTCVPLYQKAVAELNEQYPGCNFALF